MTDTLEEVLAARWSCRAFLPEPVPRPILEQITKTAGHAPSWNNTQPWQVIVTDSNETDRLRSAFYAHAETSPPSPDLDWPESYPGALGERRRACGWQLYDALGIKKEDKAARGHQMMENFRFFGAPHLAVVTSPHVLGAYGAMDTGGFVTSFCLAAQAHGVATIAQAAVAAYAPFLRDWFNIDANRLILCGIAIGYADSDHPVNSYRTSREPTEAILDWRS